MKALGLYTHTHTHTGYLLNKRKIELCKSNSDIVNDENKIEQKSYRKNAGITLIALVITIIVLLILAGVSIAALTGNNGILTQTTEAKTETRANSVKEARDLWETNKKMDQQTGTSTAQTLEQLVDDLVAQGLLTEDEKDKIIGNEAKGIEAQYGITIGKTVITFSRPIEKVEPDNIEDWEYTIDDDGFATITCYKGNDTKVVIPNSINGVDVKRVDKYNGKSNNNSPSIWADSICKEKGHASSAITVGQGTITEVTVSEGIEEIGTQTFCSSVALEKLNLPSTLRKLGECIIEYCPNLTELNIPYGITTIDNRAFDGYFHDDKLETITLPDSVTSIGEMAFRGREGLKNINIPNSITQIGDYAFWRCPNLQSIRIPTGVTNIEGGIFDECSNITNIEVEKDNVNYKSVDGMLYSKDGTKLIRGVNKENVIIPGQTKIIGAHAFSGVTSLTTVKVSDNVTNIEEEAFNGCTGLTDIKMTDNITSIGRSAFSNCSSLSSIILPNNITKIEDGMFSSCKKLSEIVIPNKVTSIGQEAFKACTSLANITIPENVVEMGSWAFAGDTITVNVYFKENERPEDWNSDWNKGYWWESVKTKVTVNYAQ